MRLLILLLVTCSAFAQTKVFMKDTTSPLGVESADGAGDGCGSAAKDYIWRQATTTQGASTTVSAAFNPTSTTPPCLQQNSTDHMRWITAPLSSGVTISSNINYSVGCQESATAMNLGYRFVVYRWARVVGGIVSTIHTSAATTECGTALALRTIAAAAPTSTAMSVGDRIAITIECQAVGGGWGANGSRTATVGYDGAAASVRDTFANFVNTLSFAADTNNARPMVGNLWDALRLWRDRWLS